MPELRSIALSVAETASLFHVQPQTVQRRLRAGELRRAETIDGSVMVRLSPLETWIRLEDASALLGVSPATIRANIRRGRLDGRREQQGRWRVLLRSVLEDPRVSDETRAVFTGSPPPSSATRSVEEAVTPRRRARLHRQINVRITDDEEELVERAQDRFGTIRHAVIAGLRAIDHENPDVDVAELTAEASLHREQLEALRLEHAALQARAHGRLVDELYCHVCEQWVPVEACDVAELPDGRLEVFHEIHGHRSGSRFRSNTGIARRAAVDDDGV